MRDEDLLQLGDLKLGLRVEEIRWGDSDLLTRLGGFGGKTLAEPPIFWTFIGWAGAGRAFGQAVTNVASELWSGHQPTLLADSQMRQCRSAHACGAFFAAALLTVPLGLGGRAGVVSSGLSILGLLTFGVGNFTSSAGSTW